MELSAVGKVAAANVQRPTYDAQPVPVQSNEVATQTSVLTTSAVHQVSETQEMNAVRQAVEEINKSMQAHEHGLRFELDEEVDKTIVSVIDQNTDEVIRQIPSEEALAIAKSIEQAIGNLIQHKV